MELKKEYLKTLLKILEVDDIISPDKIDGLLLKKMAMSNIIKSNRPAGDTGKQTHIAITSKERVLFPMVSNVAYYEGSEEAKFYDMRLPVTLIQKNIKNLDKENKIKFDGEYLETETLCYMRKGKGDIQVQISKINSDGKDFIEFRKLIHENDYMCVIKKKGEFKFFFLAFNKELKKQVLESFNTEENLVFIDNKSVTEISKKIISEEKERKLLPTKPDKPHNRIVYGAPGTGKSHQLNTEITNFERRVITSGKDESDKRAQYWLGTCGEDNHLFEEFKNKGVFAIGWEALGDPTRFSSVEELNSELIKTHSWIPQNNKTQNYFSYIMDIKKGDIILIRKGTSLEIQGYGEVSEGFSYNPDLIKGYPNIVSVEWKKTSSQVLENYSRKQLTRNTLAPANLEVVSILNEKDYFDNNIETITTTVSTVDRVTFYDGYTYGQFVGSYKPAPEGDLITYKYIPGPFMKQLLMAYKNPNDSFCLIIEEINRARADKVFGNIFQLLDRKNGISQFPVAVSEDQAVYLNKELSDEHSELLKKILSDGLYLPDNFYIWSTMNSADQGVYALDSAFKRRWHFEHIGLDDNEEEFFDKDKIPGILFQSFKNDEDEGVIYDAVSWNRFRHAINKRLLKAKVFEDRLIAPFFVKPGDFLKEEGWEYVADNLYELNESIFLDKVLMYLFDDVLKHKKKTVLFKADYDSFSELKNGYRKDNFNEFPYTNSIFEESLRKELEDISKSENLYCDRDSSRKNTENEAEED